MTETPIVSLVVFGRKTAVFTSRILPALDVSTISFSSSRCRKETTGDLSENAEYEAALEEQRDNDAKIIELEAILKDAEVADEGDIDNNRISFGCTVTVLDKETKEELTYTIKGANEVGSVAGVISNESPLGKALMGAKKGQTVDVECPVGVLKYKVLKFTREKKAE